MIESNPIKLLVIFTILSVCILEVYSQKYIEIQITNSTLLSSENEQPFWFTSNQLGKMPTNQGSFLNLTEIQLRQKPSNHPTRFESSWGASFVGGLSKSSYAQINQAYGGIHYKGWQLQGGLFADDEKWGGLSTSNGNMARSLNARPYPKIRFSTQGFKAIPGISNWGSFQAEFDEGILIDDRYMVNTKLHHKSFTLKIQPNNKWNLKLGLEHFVMWGGTSSNPNIGSLPQGLNDYLIYITGSRGDEEYPIGEQINVAGNQLGSYQASFSYQFQNWEASIYGSHPFEDLSGVNLRNWPDNLIGLHLLSFEKKRVINEILYEFSNTRNQSVHGDYLIWDESKQKWEAQQNDPYFSHYIYRSGFSYHQQMMSSPLFVPTFNSEKILSFVSNRFHAHHLGAKGQLNDAFYWNCKLTYVEHLGTYPKPYERKQNQFYTLLGFEYTTSKLPFDVGLSAAADFNKQTDKRLGFQLLLSKNW